MFNKSFFKALALGALFVSNLALSEEIPLLNHNFDSDAIDPDIGNTGFISGWVDSGIGGIGVYAPLPNGVQYHEMGNRIQVAFLNRGGKITQTSNAVLTDGETYTLNFEIGQQLLSSTNLAGRHFAVRLKANGLVLAQKHSSEMTIELGRWNSSSLSFVANDTMPLGKPLVVEFHNLATVSHQQINIDNVFLTTAGTVPSNPQDESISNLTIITQNKTLLVPEEYADINAALRYLDDKHIKVGKTVTIQVTDCTNQVYTESINVAHPNGDAIHIVGNTQDPSACVLQFNGVSGVVADNGNSIGLINGFTINGNATANSYGVYAKRIASIILGDSAVISNFDKGVVAEQNASIHASGTSAIDNLHAGYFSDNGAFINANKALAKNSGNGFTAVRGAALSAEQSEASNNSNYGFNCGLNSTIQAIDSFSINNRNGYVGWSDCSIFAENSSSIGNALNGYFATSMSYIYVKNYYIESNGSNFSPQLGVVGNGNAYILH